MNCVTTQWIILTENNSSVRSFVDANWQKWVIDPEALIAVTLLVGRFSPPLFDRALRWIVKNGSSVSVPRLLKVMKIFPPLIDARIAGGISDYVCEFGSLGDDAMDDWIYMGSVARECIERSSRKDASVAFFLGVDEYIDAEGAFPDASAGGRNADPIFERWGVIRHRFSAGFHTIGNSSVPAGIRIRIGEKLDSRVLGDIIAYIGIAKSRHFGTSRSLAENLYYPRDRISDAVEDGIDRGLLRKGRNDYFSLSDSGFDLLAEEGCEDALWNTDWVITYSGLSFGLSFVSGYFDEEMDMLYTELCNLLEGGDK
ncbi:hypothetical protein DRJ17_04770 [Candidatus Woesearchaeota archaeon]|nr:MAG: hypothetical protein DRJ17_04770 [Candidatus Woesearchaeota archaeon]